MILQKLAPGNNTKALLGCRKAEYEKIQRSDRMKLEEYIGYTENTFGGNNLIVSTATAQENRLGRLHWHDSIFS